MEKERKEQKKNNGKYVHISFSTMLESENGRKKTVRIKSRIFYREKGEGPNLLLLHDAGQSGAIYRKLLNELSKNYHVIVPDLPGHGNSDCPDMDYTIQDFSLAIEAILKALKIFEVSILAYGQSAAYCIDYCLYNRSNVDKLIFLNPGALYCLDFAHASKLSTFFGRWIISRYKNPAYMRKQMEKAFFDKTVLKEQDVKAFCRPYIREDVQFCVRLAVANYDDEKILENLKKIDIPVLYLRGSEDTFSDHKMIEEYIQNTEQPYEMEIRNCGAWLQLEKAQSISQGILRFLNE